MSLRTGLLISLLVCGCNSDALVIVLDGGLPADRSAGLGFDIEMPDLADVAGPDLTTAPKTWIRQLETTSWNYARDVATDRGGNVYVAGTTGGALDGNQNAGREDAFLVKYDTNGSKLWARQLGSVGDDFGDGVAVDDSGGVYLMGITTGALDRNQNAGGWDTFLVKYDANGNMLWTRQFGTPADEGGDRVTTDGMGSVFIAGCTDGALDGNPNAGNRDAFLVKYDTNGSKLWTRQLGSAYDDCGTGVATDGIGYVCVTGWTSGGLDGKQNAGVRDAFLVKYDTNGSKRWTRQLGSAYDDRGMGVATDGPGNVYVTGNTSGGLDGNQNAGDYDAFLFKYDANGNRLWTRQLGTPRIDEAGYVARDRAGNVYVAGHTLGRLDGNQNVGSYDAFLVKYDADGKKLWTRQFGTTEVDYSSGVAVDGTDGIYVTGRTDGAFAGYHAGEHAFLARFPAAP